MYRLPRFAKKIEFYRYVECTELGKFNGKLCTLDVWIVWIYRKFEFFKYVECTKLCKFNVKFCTLDVWIVWISR